jgi:hypothetical protein
MPTQQGQGGHKDHGFASATARDNDVKQHPATNAPDAARATLVQSPEFGVGAGLLDPTAKVSSNGSDR